MNTLNPIPKNSAQLNIALVTETYLPEVNGVAITVARMVEGLLQRGHRIHLLRPRQHAQDVAAQHDDYQESLFNGMAIPGYATLNIGLPAKARLVKLWTTQRPDIVHIATEGPLGWSALAAARKLKLPVSSDFHTNFQNYTGHYGMAWLRKPMAAYLRYFHNKAACTLVPTRALHHELTQDGYQNVRVVVRGVDTALFNPAKRDAALRSAWGADENTPVVMLVSRLAAEKNLPVVFEAFANMQPVDTRAKLVIVGDGPARAELQALHPDVIFAGMQTGEALAQHYASGDIFLYPSLTETYGNVTVEAMASGLATLAYDYAAAHQHIRHEVNGLLAPYADTATFIKQATGLIANPARVQRMRVAARDTVAALTWQHIMGDMEAVLFDTVRTQGEKHVSSQKLIASATTD
ncbi:MAG: glycosyltransferase family 1 protein [Gallionella sp.]